ncbi:hypothetical protein Tco_0870388 [Tanacetum coccineum]
MMFSRIAIVALEACGVGIRILSVVAGYEFSGLSKMVPQRYMSVCIKVMVLVTYLIFEKLAELALHGGMLLYKFSPWDLTRILLPGLSYAIQSLPMGNSDLIGGGGPTCALTEVPVITGNNGNNVSNPQPVEAPVFRPKGSGAAAEGRRGMDYEVTLMF